MKNILLISAIMILVTLSAVPAVRAHASFYVSKYADPDLLKHVSPSPVPRDFFPVSSLVGETYGRLSSSPRRDSGNFTITNLDLAPNVSVTQQFRPDGTFDSEFIPGHYRIILLKGNGEQPESTDITVVAGQTTHFFFTGNIASGGGDGGVGGGGEIL